jgi:hypothetical protein
MINVYDALLYLLNSILVIFGILFMTYSIEYFSDEKYYCDNLYFLSIMIIINSIICLISIKKIKVFGLITTILLFIYNIYNIIVIPCTLKNYIFNSYISVIIMNGITILVYIVSYNKNIIINQNELNLL